MIGRHREELVDRRSISRRHDAPGVEELAVAEDAKRERRPSEPGADGADVEVDGRLVESWIAGHDAEHFAIVWPVRRADADREHGWATFHGTRPTRPTYPHGPTCPSVATVRQDDDPRNPLAAIPLAHGGQGARQIRPACVSGEPIDLNRRQAVADAVQLRDEARRQRRQQVRFEQRDRPRQPRLAVRVGEPHAARHVDQHRHDRVTGSRRRQHRDGPE